MRYVDELRMEVPVEPFIGKPPRIVAAQRLSAHGLLDTELDAVRRYALAIEPKLTVHI
jgi:hypothetical protein